MGIDTSQFINTFLEESLEGLDVMETQLLAFDATDAEGINTIFRAAHSIKGGAGTFGFSAISQFTHAVETLLDQMRDGRRTMTDDTCSALLESVDCLREMLQAVRDGSDFDATRAAAVSTRLERLLESVDPAADNSGAEGAAPPAARAAAGGPAPAGWRIDFRPDADMLRTGNEPLRMFSALAELGDLEVICHTDDLPALAALDPESCRLHWTLELAGAVERDAVVELFEWVVDECELVIEPLSVAAPGDDAPDQQHAGGVGVTDGAATDSPDTGRTRTAPREAGSIRVGIDKIDSLINMVGELVITQSMLSQVGEGLQATDGAALEKLREGLGQLERNTRELQESVMSIRMLPISFVFNRVPRLAHDLGEQLGKRVELSISGENTELDKTVMEKIGDPLVHLVRNAIDHGIETVEQRTVAGKPPAGSLSLQAYHQGGNIIIQIADDGAGLNRERILSRARERGLVAADAELSPAQIDDLIFAPGFSTAAEVSEVSGRGVGMDVVRRNIKGLGGSVEVHTRPGEGSRFTIRLPLTLAILDGQLVQVAGETYVVPLISIVESLQTEPGQLKTVVDSHRLYRLRDEYIPVLSLAGVFHDTASAERERTLLVVVEAEGEKIALEVDDLLGQQQVVIKSLESNFKRVSGLAGATILGDGTVALILDIAGLAALDRGTGNVPPPSETDSVAAA